MFDPAKFRLDGQVALVTGAGAGIGRGIAEMFAGAGASVVVSDLKKETADEVAKGITEAGGKAVGLACNVTKEEDLQAAVQAAIDNFGSLSILVNNAGGGGPKPFDMPMDDFRWAYELNVFAPFRLTQLAVPHMEKAGGGAVLNISSMSAREQERAHGLLLLVEGGDQPPDAQHRLRPRAEEHPRQRHRAGCDPDGGAGHRAHAGGRAGHAQAHSDQAPRRARGHRGRRALPLFARGGMGQRPDPDRVRRRGAGARLTWRPSQRIDQNGAQSAHPRYRETPMSFDAFADFRMDGHNVIITGAAQNIGAQIAKTISAAGAKVMICDLQAEKSADTASDIAKETGNEVHGMGCDVTKDEDIQAVVDAAAKAFGGVSTLINNVGWGARQPDPAAISREEFLKSYNLNTVSAYRMSMACLPYLEKAENATITNSGSFSSAVPAYDILPYGTAKAALNQMMVSLAHMLAAKVRVNSVLIGTVITPGYADAGVTPEMQEKLSHPDNLVGRAGKMEDIANAMLYLASPASSWVSGQIINVHGGGHVTRLFG
jgi:7-alpha-hydroxysteroid dehydrogenase